MKIVIFSTQSWSDFWVSKHWLAYFLSVNGHKVTFVEPFVNRANRDVVISDTLIVRKKGVRLPYFYRYNLILKVIYYKLTYSEEVDSADIVISFDPSAAVASSISFRRKQIIYYSVDPPLGFGRLYEELFANKLSAKAFTVNAQRSSLSKSSLVKWEFLPHAFLNINKEYVLSDLQKQVLSNRSVCHIIYIGSLNGSYVDIGVVEMITSNPKLCLHVFGPQSNSALSESDSYTVDILKSEVHMWGGVNYSEIASLLANFDAGILLYNKSKLRNGLRKSPLKLANYIANKLPVITTDIPGIYNYPIQDMYIVNTEGPDVLETFIEDWEEQKLKTVSEYFDPEAIAHKILDV